MKPIYLLLSYLSICTIMNAQPSKENTQTGIYISNLKQIARLTGQSLPDEKTINPNQTAEDYDVYGTDLGIMWQMKGNQIGMFFGDTSGKGFVAGKGGGNGTNWRSNVVAFSTDTFLEDGLTIRDMALDKEGKAREICAGGKTNPSKYQTSIPTGAIRAAGLDCIHYMNIYDWTGPEGRWYTNFSSLYTSSDNGKNWIRQEKVTFHADSHFSQVSYAKKDKYVYMLGTQSGRGDDAYLARFLEKNLLNKQKYEYWNGKIQKWVKGDETAATPVIPGPIGETSLMYHEKFKKWIVTYNYDYAYDKNVRKKKHAIMYRDADDITKWGKMKVLVSDEQYPDLYCAYMHPLKNNSDKLYFLMSRWEPYNVFLMSVDLDCKKEE